MISHTTLEAVVAVEGATPLSVPRPYLDIRTARPAEWTVLRNPAVAARTPFAFRRGYLICPGCSERVPLPQSHLQEQLCPRCSHIFPIAWSEHYLEDISE